MTAEDALSPDLVAPPVSGTRDRFLIPRAPDGSSAIYLAGQSLGLQPRTAAAAIAAELDAWADLGVDAWFDARHSWFTRDADLRASMARVVGARLIEVALLNSLTVNLGGEI